MNFVDYEFAERALSVLPRYRKLPGSTFKLNCRCPICGDSQKNQMKARFWCFEVEGGLRVGCFNCDYKAWFTKFLKETDETLYREFLLERRKENMYREKKAPSISEKIKAKMPVIEKLPNCERLDRLPADHPIVKYVKARCIPEVNWKRLWFTMEWPALVNSVNPGTYKDEKSEPRLVIPIFNARGDIESFQGRALRKDAPQKYITIKAHEHATKIYGLDTVDESRLVWVMEGPIDSLFVPNAIAITGGSMDLNTVPFKENRAWIMDNEPRHEDTIKRMKRLVEAGERVVFWDNAPWASKDINDMIKDEGATPEEILKYLNTNIASGLMAKMRLSRYAKV
ncbi:DNA primase [Klebsiella phage PhiKpNIH-6]|jgi:hypothetical protein|uniref:DNA primase / DNA helicase n=2 Tax=Marfavirus F48 TaxID=2845079 RepID=A0A2I6UFI1_9CAUD|nr:DNA primase [Klebsiella phage vB_Kpn_F48]QHB49377.1 DNA primase [Klebsiella phage PhiKpNIH-6]UEP19321.1 DNA primase / DNA helicase [Klebsiella phage vB_KpnM-VAC36]UJD05810.1 DNA primase [Klebsiella phage PWKp18]WKC55978.1 DNA primase [Klebsiella phage R3_1]AUO78731.1 DNA primase / DNA helicase [Klebsiella phage vB_Kpn_F48]